MPDGSVLPMRVRSMVGLIPLFAVAVVDQAMLERLPGLIERMTGFFTSSAATSRHWFRVGTTRVPATAVCCRSPAAFRMTKLLERMLDEDEFLSPHGVRALSRTYLDHPYRFRVCNGVHYEVKYLPAKVGRGLFGGNSNWRGPIWMPVNYLLIESLRRFHSLLRRQATPSNARVARARS